MKLQVKRIYSLTLLYVVYISVKSVNTKAHVFEHAETTCTKALFSIHQKASFIGKGALLRQKEEGVSRRLVQFHLKNHDIGNDIWPWGGEPIYRNGKKNHLFCIILNASVGIVHNCVGSS